MKMLLLGDVCPTDVTAPIFKKKDTQTLFHDAVSLFKDQDFTFVNLECALTECENGIKKYGPALKAPYETAEVLKELGVDCCGLSNNHVFDYGKQGARDTIEALKKNGIQYTGFGENYEDSRKNLIIQNEHEKVTLISVCEHEYSYALDNRMGSRPYDEYHTMEDIRKAKEQSDRVIVIYHGGKEFCRYPSPRLHRLCHAMIRNGADVVLCQHSHCIGSYENYQGGHILYGQGNFHFVKPNFHFVKPHDFEGWHTSLAVHYDSKENSIEFTPLKCTEAGIAIADTSERKTILQEFELRNETLLNGKWIEGWKAFCESMRTTYTQVLINAFKEGATERQYGMFSHYLDCEAHTDVWRELFPSYNLTNCMEED